MQQHSVTMIGFGLERRKLQSLRKLRLTGNAAALQEKDLERKMKENDGVEVLTVSGVNAVCVLLYRTHGFHAGARSRILKLSLHGDCRLQRAERRKRRILRVEWKKFSTWQALGGKSKAGTTTARRQRGARKGEGSEQWVSTGKAVHLCKWKNWEAQIEKFGKLTRRTS